MSDALFYDAHSALLECFQILATPVMPANVLGKMQKRTHRASRKWEGLTPLEKQGQAAQVIAIVERMTDNPAGQEWILARYAGVLGAEYMKNLIPAVIRSLPTGVHNRRGIHSAMKAYFGHPISDRSVAYDLQCRHKDLKEITGNINHVMDSIGNRAMEYVSIQLETKGIIAVTADVQYG